MLHGSKTASHKIGVRQGSLVFGWIFHIKTSTNEWVSEWVSEWDRLLNVTCNDISVIYVTAHSCAGRLKKWDLRSGSNCHRHFVVLFNVSVQAPTRDQPFYGYSEKPPHFNRILRRAWGYKDHTRVPTEELQPMWERTISLVAEFGLVLLWRFRLLCFVSLLWQWISPKLKFQTKLIRLCM